MADNAKTARLIMQLVDHVSGPAKKITGTLGTLDKATRRIVGMGGLPGAISGAGRRLRSNTYTAAGIGAPLGLGAAAAAKSVYNFEKAGNAMQAFGLLTEQQRTSLEDYAQKLNKDFPFTNQQIIEAAQELFRAGLTYDQAMGSLRGTLELAMAGKLQNSEATDIATNVMTAMKLPMATFDQVTASMQRVNDALAYAATTSNTDVRLMGDTFRYVAPLAAIAGMSLEEVSAVAAELARNGIKGSEAGVALRSALVRMAKPTKPMLAAFERLNIDMADFVKYQEKIEARSIIGSLLAEGIDASHLSGEIQSILDDKTLAGAPTRMAAQLTDLIVQSFGDEALRSDIAEAMQNAVLVGAQKVDLLKLLGTLRDKNATITDITQIFDVRMGSRLAAILYSDMQSAVERTLRESPGVSQKMAGIMMGGIVGEWAAIVAATENMFIAIANSGVLSTVSKAFDALTAFLNKLAAVNPRLLEMGTYAAVGIAAIAPLGLIFSGLSGALGLVLSPLGIVVGGLGTLAAFKWEGVKAGLEGVGEGFKSAISPEVAEKLQGLIEKFEKLFNWAQTSPDVEAWRSWGEKIGKIFADIANAIEVVISAMQAVQNGAKWWGENMSLYGNFKKAGNALREAVDNRGSTSSEPVAPGAKRHRAAGGPMRAGFTYSINERGTEMITPGRNSYVTPNHKLGGGVTMNITQHITGSNADEIAKKLGVQLRSLLMDARQTSMEGGPVYG
ncbi:phage tail tape measure protein [Hoeflea sp. WL0058]|uniref:Phage tail tape measure protein n=1 Tax=Flavimaribacter sediminis TaxID=2865987 RepID=A0AAE2ZIS4_9HYPH|nr:phage tail tape measure protein [Flavimaribacter sediminis]MBW8636971.1 phage tail tape measure protein [Flavimaribacter sediminis]